MKKSVFIQVLLLTLLLPIMAQDDAVPYKITTRKGKMNFAWGYNREVFSKSDIHLWGDGYNFVLRDVVAKDYPSPFSFKTYLGPNSLTIPQFNARLAYFITDNIQISFGYDHMKYVVQQNQEVSIDGYISHTRSNQFPGIYNGNLIKITPNFLMFEHTDGLNYFSIEADYFYNLWKHKNDKHAFSAFGGIGVGFVMPRSDISVFGEAAANIFHIAGFGTSIHTGIRFEFYKHFFIQGLTKGGFINLSDVITIENRKERAAHDFFFLEGMIQLGGYWRIIKK
ncbi:MAG: hypothetical protein ACK4K0_10405 [Flavobacteriales bacterium]